MARACAGLLPLMLFVILATSCHTADTVDPEALAPGEYFTIPAAQDIRDFREFFYNYAQDEMDEAEFIRTALIPDAGLYQFNKIDFKAIVDQFSTYRAEVAYRRSIFTPPKGVVPDPPASIPPMTLIVMPGIFSELAVGHIFSEAVDNYNSSFARLVRSKLAKADKKYTRDYHFSLEKLKNVDVPLTDLVRAGSIDDRRGRPLVKVIFLLPKFGSLESVGKIEDRYATHKRRLDKFFNVVGVQPRVYISGHSRGAAIALDFVSRISKDKKAEDWAKEIEGFVSFNGALFGSHYANAYFDPKQRPYKLHKPISAMKRLRAKDNAAVSLQNRNKMLQDLFSLAKEYLFEQEYKSEPWISLVPDVTAGLKIARTFEAQFAPNSYFGDYDRHIRRINIATIAMENAIRELTHTSRLKWWSTHTLPTNLVYLSVSSTMPSPFAPKQRPTPWQQSLVEAYSMQRDSLDYAILRGFYYDYFKDARVTLNDGLVGVHEGTFWPELHRKMNPKQQPYEATPIALFNSHHFAVAYAQTTTDNEGDANPFPRKAFLKALAHYTAARLVAPRGREAPAAMKPKAPPLFPKKNP
jgi:hypothetical protein